MFSIGLFALVITLVVFDMFNREDKPRIAEEDREEEKKIINSKSSMPL